MKSINNVFSRQIALEFDSVYHKKTTNWWFFYEEFEIIY